MNHHYSTAPLVQLPRYCPSIEDKVYRFSEKNSHQIFLEPETSNNLRHILMVCLQVCRSKTEGVPSTIHGLENCEITQPGYAIEYSYLIQGT